MELTKVLIIGAGAAGLCAAKHVISTYKFSCRLFEQTGTVGGTWVYTDEIYKDKFGLPIHSSMYQRLKTNLPKEVMQFLDFPFSSAEESFLHHSDVLHYLKNYVEYYGLYKYIEFHKKVETVQPQLDSGTLVWKVLVKDLVNGKMEEYVFDVLMVCNGHYSQPKMPDIPGIQNFKGLVIHSHEFRTSDPFKGKNVVVWGASASGLDISLEISNVAKAVSICQRFPENVKYAFPENVRQAANVVSATECGFKLEDGTICEADAFMYCTGYHYNFPFLSKDCKIEVRENRVIPLYKHLINIEYPTMCLVGIPFVVLPFVMFDYQVQFFLKTLDGTITLPSKEDMKEDSEKDFEMRLSLGMPPRYAHKLDFLQWEYFEYLATSAKTDKLPPVMKNIYDDIRVSMRSDITLFKKYKYEILDNENFRKSKLYE